MKTPFFRRRSHHDAAQSMGFISCEERSNQGNKKPVYQNSEGVQIETRVFLTEYSGKNAYKLCRHPFFQKLNELFIRLTYRLRNLWRMVISLPGGAFFTGGFTGAGATSCSSSSSSTVDTVIFGTFLCWVG
jgi:hypothetical protein